LLERDASARLAAVTGIGRRRFFGWIAAGAVVAGGGLALIRASGYAVGGDVARQLKLLKPWQYVVVTAFGRRVLWPETADVGLFIDGYMVGLADKDRDDLLHFITYLEQIAPLADGHVSRFSSLGPETQDSVLASLERSPVHLLRAGFEALKAMTDMAYYRLPKSWPRIGYGGPIVVWSP
jgi:hypothetical protein